MQSFTRHTGTSALLARDNVDTDQIIPKQFLKRIERTGYGDVLFFDWRYDPEGLANPAFALNAPQYSGASFLITGKNFGCGSSREHAVWALRDYGFRAVLGVSFADIFVNNCVRNGLLPVVLSPAEIANLTSRARLDTPLTLTVDLEQGKVSADGGFSASFQLEPFRRMCLLEGLDEIGMTLKHDAEIASFEKDRPAFTHHA
ncbi:MAG TPA: 3-isopropylmalate dehydratase small subunit [Verrucomicrobiae bacterium]|jgi:3-isopropylmalate/(R)-2-methylmalate dehydratase small subunit|nr:3-isopropylmalate dehydratase small subunit [Verrucomicrobiae bacterium]